MHNHAGLPVLKDYYQAKQHYDNVRSIRGRSGETKPLGKQRRYDQYLIQQTMRADQSQGITYTDYVCTLYGYPVVTFMQDGRVKLTPHWQSVPTRCVMHYVLREHGVVDSQSGKWYFINKRKEAFLIDKDITLKFDAEGILTGEMRQEHKHLLKRKVMNDLRNRYKFFTDYAYTMLSLDPITTRLEVAESNHGLSFQTQPTFLGHRQGYWSSESHENTPPKNRAKLFQALDRPNASTDASLLYELATCIAYVVGRYDYTISKSVCEPWHFIESFNEVLKYHFADVVFEKVEQPLGFLFVDKNAKYIPYKK
jgi:hypothetical protein